MGIRNLMNDKVTIIKKDNAILNDIQASVQKNKIFIADGSLPIEDGEVVIRVLPSGVIEEYIIEDKGFHTGLGTIPDHYQMSVVKKDSIKPEEKDVYGNLKFTVNNDARVYINSHDNSINIQYSHEVFKDLIREINEIDEHLLPKKLKEELINDVKELEKSVDDKEKFGFKFTQFIGKTGKIISIVSPYVDLLTKFL